MTRNCLSMRRLRKERHDLGLTSAGFEPVNKRHPDLAGLTGTAYHTAYMKKQREQDRLNWAQPQNM